MHQRYLPYITKLVKPRYFHEVIKDPNWKEAIAKEIEALEANETWKVADLPPGKKLINCK